MDFGNLAGGLAQGLGAGLGMRNQMVQQQNEQRRMAILEQGAKQDQEIKQATIDRQKREQDTYDQLAKLVDQFAGGPAAAGGETAGGQGDPATRISYGLHRNPNLMRDTRFLNSAASLFLKSGMPDGIKWLEAGHKAASENRIEGLQRMLSGDLAGAAQVMGVQAIAPVVGQDGKPTGQFQVTGADGATQLVDAKTAYRATLSPADFFRTQREEEELTARKELWGAQREWYAGRNDTQRDVAETRRDQAIDVAEIRAEGRGGTGGGTGRGRGGGGGAGNLSKWMEDYEKVMPTKDVLDEKGRPVTYMKGGNQETRQELDKTLARPMRDMARVNAEVLEASGMAPGEAADTFAEIAATFRDKKPAEAYETLRQGRGLVFARDGQGNAKRVAIQVGTFQDKRPMLIQLTPEQEKLLLGEDKRRQLESPKQKQAYRQEEERMLKRAPAPAAGTGTASAGATAQRRRAGASGQWGRPAATTGIK